MGRSCLRTQLERVILSAITFHEKAGWSQVDSFVFLVDKLFSCRVATVAMLPFALSGSDSRRSVHVGRSQFSRCCHLISALWLCSLESRTWGQALVAVTGTRLWAFDLPLVGTILNLVLPFYAAAATVTRLLLCNDSYTSPLTHK